MAVSILSRRDGSRRDMAPLSAYARPGAVAGSDRLVPMTCEPTHPSVYLPGADPRLIVADMDGTLLDGEGRIPEELWGLLDVMRERGIVFVPASGRQYFTLEGMFERASCGMPFICENGTFVVRDGEEMSSCSLPRADVVRTVELLRGLRERDLGIVIAGKKCGYFDRTEPDFRVEVDKYYRRSAYLEDILDYDDDVNKIAIYDFGDAEQGTFRDLQGALEGVSVVVSAKHWIDVMRVEANKGNAVKSLQAELGITRDQTVAFGDYFNDLEMLEASGMSFAMADAHPGILEASRYVAPSHTEHGVIAVLKNLLGLKKVHQATARRSPRHSLPES